MQRKSFIKGLADTNQKQRDLNLLNKISNKASAPKVMRGNNITSLIEEIKIKVSKYLGKYKDKVKSVRSEQELVEYIDSIIDKGIYALDTETTGLDCLNDEVVGTCLYAPGLKAIYVPHKHKSYITGQYLNNQISYEFMAHQLQRLKDAGIRVIMHNGKFDKRTVNSNMHVDLDCYWDTMLGAKLLNNTEEANLKYQYSKHVAGEDKSYDFSKLFSSVEYAMVPVETAALYAATDPLITYELYEYQVEEFKKYPGIYKVFTEIEMKVLPVVAEMENNGVQLDLDKAKELSIKYHGFMEKAEKDVYTEVDKYKPQIMSYISKFPACKLSNPINIGSPTQLAILLYDIIRVDVVDNKKPRGTREEILEKINLPLCKAILKYREIAKLLSTYIDKLPTVVNPKTGRIHASFNQIGADCIVGNSYVVTPNGVDTIENLVGTCEDKQYTPHIIPLINENNCTENTSYKIKFENVPTIKIETEHGYCLEGTPNHPIRVLNRNINSFRKNKSQKVLRELWNDYCWKTLDKLCVNDLVVLDSSVYCFNQPYIETNFYQNLCNKTHKKSTKMPTHIDEDFGLFLGMLHSDGSLKRREGSWNLTLFNEHEDVVKEWKRLCEKLFELTPKKVWSSGNSITGYYICASKLSQLQKYFITGKSNKRIPKEILQSNDNVFYAYLRGCSLDSGYSGCEVLHYSFINEDDCHAVQQRLLKQGILSSTHFKANRKNKSEDCQLIVKGLNFEKLVTLTGNLFRKSIVKQINQKQYTFNRYYETNGRIAVPIKNITHSCNTVYDFTLPETHSFLSNGFICHNTGRFSSSDPNLQNIPSHNDEIRTMFSCPDNYVLISSDFSQQEPKLLTYYTQDKAMLDAYAHNKDLYAQIASLSFNRKYDDCLEFYPEGTVIQENGKTITCGYKTHTNKDGKKYRSSAKNILLGIMYGRGPASIAEQLECSTKEANKIIESFYNAFPTVKGWMDKTVEFARKNGYVETFYGRRRYIKNIQLNDYDFEYIDNKPRNFDPLNFDTEEEFSTEVDPQDIRKYTKLLNECKGYKDKESVKQRAIAEGIKIHDNGGYLAEAIRQCVNSRIQGGAAEQSKLAMINIANCQELKDLGFKLLIGVHDELIGEAPLENAKRCGELLSECMRNAAADILKLPAKCDVSITKCWYGEEITV